MNQSMLIKIVTAISILLIAAYFLWPTTPQILPQKNEVQVNLPTTVVAKPSIKPVEVIAQEKPKVSLLSTNKSAVFISKVYAQELSFPVYSQPLKPTDFDRLNPNYFNPQNMPIDDEGNSINASLSKYRYSYPEPIVAKLEGESIKGARFSLIDSQTNKELASAIFKKQDQDWQVNLAGKKEFPESIHIKVVADVGHKSVPIVLALKYNNPVAIIEAFEPAKADGADMVVTAKLTTKKAGLYRVRANLFDANDQPIAHLVTKSKLTTGLQKVALKTHQSVLQNRQPPFYLSTFMIELMSPSPGVRKKFGESAIKKYEIKNFAVSSLATQPYESSPQEKQRLELLQSMANGQ